MDYTCRLKIQGIAEARSSSLVSEPVAGAPFAAGELSGEIQIATFQAQIVAQHHQIEELQRHHPPVTSPPQSPSIYEVRRRSAPSFNGTAPPPAICSRQSSPSLIQSRSMGDRLLQSPPPHSGDPRSVAMMINHSVPSFSMPILPEQHQQLRSLSQRGEPHPSPPIFNNQQSSSLIHGDRRGSTSSFDGTAPVQAASTPTDSNRFIYSVHHEVSSRSASLRHQPDSILQDRNEGISSDARQVFDHKLQRAWKAIREVNMMYKEDRFLDAVDHYLNVKSSFDDIPTVKGSARYLQCLANLMACYLRIGYYWQCVDLGTEILKYDSKNSLAFIYREQAYQLLGLHEEAESEMMKFYGFLSDVELEEADTVAADENDAHAIVTANQSLDEAVELKSVEDDIGDVDADIEELETEENEVGQVGLSLSGESQARIQPGTFQLKNGDALHDEAPHDSFFTTQGEPSASSTTGQTYVSADRILVQEGNYDEAANGAQGMWVGNDLSGGTLQNLFVTEDVDIWCEEIEQKEAGLWPVSGVLWLTKFGTSQLHHISGINLDFWNSVNKLVDKKNCGKFLHPSQLSNSFNCHVNLLEPIKIHPQWVLRGVVYEEKLVDFDPGRAVGDLVKDKNNLTCRRRFGIVHVFDWKNNPDFNLSKPSIAKALRELHCMLVYLVLRLCTGDKHNLNDHGQNENRSLSGFLSILVNLDQQAETCNEKEGEMVCSMRCLFLIFGRSNIVTTVSATYAQDVHTTIEQRIQSPICIHFNYLHYSFYGLAKEFYRKQLEMYKEVSNFHEGELYGMAYWPNSFLQNLEESCKDHLPKLSQSCGLNLYAIEKDSAIGAAAYDANGSTTGSQGNELSLNGVSLVYDPPLSLHLHGCMFHGRKNDEKMFDSNRFELEAISNLLKEAQNLNISQFGYDEAVSGVTSRFCELECGEEEDWRMHDYVQQGDTCIEIAIQMQKEQLSVELNKIDAKIMKNVNNMQQLEFKLGPASAFDDRSIVLPLVKSVLQLHLEELVDKDAGMLFVFDPGGAKRELQLRN